MSNPFIFRSLFAFSMRIIGLDVCCYSVRLLIGLIHNNRHAFLRAAPNDKKPTMSRGFLMGTQLIKSASTSNHGEACLP